MTKVFEIEIAAEGVKPAALYTAREAATLLRVSARTLERWRSDGRGPRVTRLWANGRPLYLGRDLFAALDRSADD